MAARVANPPAGCAWERSPGGEAGRPLEGGAPDPGAGAACVDYGRRTEPMTWMTPFEAEMSTFTIPAPTSSVRDSRSPLSIV